MAVLNKLESAELSFNSDEKLVYFLKDVPPDCVINCLINSSVKTSIAIIDFTNASFSLKFNADLKQSASLTISVVSLAHKDDKKVFDISVNHQERDSYSKTKMGGINYGGVLKFLGSSKIENGAINSDTRQEGRITNLAASAKSEVSPALLIDENDVKASHGATLGAYNIDHLFYLMSRGLKESEAKMLITLGTLLPIIEETNEEEVVKECKDILLESQIC